MKYLVSVLLLAACTASRPQVALYPKTVAINGETIADPTLSSDARHQKLSSALKLRGGSQVELVASDDVQCDELMDAYFTAREAGFTKTELAFLPGVIAGDAAGPGGASVNLLVWVEKDKLYLTRKEGPGPSDIRSARLHQKTATVDELSGTLRKLCDPQGCDRGTLRVAGDVQLGTLKLVLTMLSSASTAVGKPLALSLPPTRNEVFEAPPEATGSDALGDDATHVAGRLPPEVIQRIVRQNFGRFRSCYEQGLGRNSKLEGKVTARFVIARDGSVSNVSDGGSTMPDDDVKSCVLNAFYGLKFPEPEGGIVTVVYPIMLAPG